MAQTVLTGGAAIVLAEPIDDRNQSSNMFSVEIYQAAGVAVYLAVNNPLVDNTNGFLLPAGQILHMVLKPYEVLYAYSAGTPTVYTLKHVSEHVRNS